MSRSVSIDFSFRGATRVTVQGILRVLEPGGWGTIEPLGLSFAVEDAMGDLDWTATVPEQLNSVVAALDDPGRVHQHVGICVYHQAAGTGGQLLFFPGREQISFLPTINRRAHVVGPEFTDIPWYLEQMLPAFYEAGMTGYETEDVAD